MNIIFCHSLKAPLFFLESAFYNVAYMPQHFLVLYVPYRESGNVHYSSKVQKYALACGAVKMEGDYSSVSTVIHLDAFQLDLTSMSAFAFRHYQLPHTGFLMNLSASRLTQILHAMSPAENR
jgi:hypothetical protein